MYLVFFNSDLHLNYSTIFDGITNFSIIRWKTGVYSEKKSYIYEISSDQKLNAKAVYDAAFSLRIGFPLMLQNNYCKNLHVRTCTSMVSFI